MGAALQLRSGIRAGSHDIHPCGPLGRPGNIHGLAPGRTAVFALDHEIADALFIIPPLRNIGLPFLHPGGITLEDDGHRLRFGIINRAWIVEGGSVRLGNGTGRAPRPAPIFAHTHDNIVFPLVRILVSAFGKRQKLSLPDLEQSRNADGRIRIPLPGAEHGHGPVRGKAGLFFLPQCRQCYGTCNTHQTLEHGIHHPSHPIPFPPSRQQPCHELE